MRPDRRRETRPLPRVPGTPPYGLVLGFEPAGEGELRRGDALFRYVAPDDSVLY